MNRYMLIDFEENTIFSLAKVDIDFKENEEQTSSTKCIDKSDLLNTLKEEIDEFNDLYNCRVCDYCHKVMQEGYCIDDGQEYFCSDVCLHSKYNDDEYNDMYHMGCAYWTTWED